MEKYEEGDEVYYIGMYNFSFLKKAKVIHVSASIFIEFNIRTERTHVFNFAKKGRRGYCWYANKRYITKDKAKVMKLMLDNKGSHGEV